MDDQIAIQRLKERDVSGLEYLVAKYQEKATQAAWLILKDRQAAEDIASQAFLRAYRSIHQFKKGSEFSPWFYRIVVNLCLDQIKHDQRYMPIEEFGYQETLFSHQAEESVERELEKTQTIQEMMHAFEQLKPQHRAVLVARYFLGLTEKATAQNLKMPLSTVKWRNFTAIQQLRQALIPSYQMKKRKEE